MKLVFFGSGEFGGPTFQALTDHHDVALVVTQPDRPAGRKRVMTPTPIGAVAASKSIPTIKPESVNDLEIVDRIHAVGADAFVVIAYGQKLGAALLADRFAINLHSSLLPRYRGAAPINWAVLNADAASGVSVITLASRMDAGQILAQERTPIDPMETAGELHDRLALLGPDIVERVLREFESGSLQPRAQDDDEATHARKLSADDRVIDFTQPARLVQARVHGLTPWPGVSVTIGEVTIKVQRVATVDADSNRAPGTLLDAEGRVACGQGSVQLLEVQPPGKRSMSWSDFARGNPVEPGITLR